MNKRIVEKFFIFLLCLLILFEGKSFASIVSDYKPQVVGATFLNFMEPRGVYVSGNYAYVVDEDASLKVIDVSNPENPKIVGFVYLGDTAYAIDVYVSGNYAYVVDEDAGLKVVDITNPESPKVVGSADVGHPYDVYVSGNYAYIADGYKGLKVVDITNPENPKIVGSVDTDYAIGVYVSGNYAYVADGGAGLKIIDISNPKSLEVVDSVNIETATIWVLGNYVYILGYTGIKVMDFSNPENPQIISSVYVDSGNGKFYVSGNYIYVAGGKAGLEVIDISDPKNPKVVSSIDTGYASDVYVSESYAYVVGYEGLKVIDISNLENLKVVSSIDTYISKEVPIISIGFGIYSVRGVYVSGNYAYIADGDRLKVISVGDPEKPKVVSSIDTGGNVIGIYVSGNYAYVADGKGLKVIDVSNPLNPKIVGSVDTDYAIGVYVSGNYAYVADTEGLMLISLSYSTQKILSVSAGWNLLSLPFKISVSVEELGNFTILWKYLSEENRWVGWSPNKEIMEIIDEYVGVGMCGLTETVNWGEGFWILSSKGYTLNFEGNETYGINDIKLQVGKWNLVGTGTSVYAGELKNLSNVEIIWKYNNGKWEAYSPNPTIMEIIQSYADKGSIGVLQQINSGEGFWVKVEP